jgi:hypothetical protein
MRMHGRLRETGEPVAYELVQVWTGRDGKAIKLVTYPQRANRGSRSGPGRRHQSRPEALYAPARSAAGFRATIRSTIPHFKRSRCSISNPAGRK